MYVGKKIKRLRQAINLTQNEFAEKLGVSQPYYSAIESGKKQISKKMLADIYTIWGVSNAYFDTKENDKEIEFLRVFNGGINRGVNGGDNKYIETPQADLIANETDQDNNFKQITKDFLKKLYESPNWSKSQKLKLELYDKYKSKDYDAISTIKAYRDLTAKVLKFINSIDTIFDEHIERKLFDDLNAGKSEADILENFEADLNNIAQVEPILQELNSHLENSINRLKPFDKNLELQSNGEEEYYQHLLAQEYDVVTRLKDKIKIYKKYLL